MAKYLEVLSQQGRQLLNTGYTLQVDGGFGNVLLPNGIAYAIVQFNFRFPSFHKLPNGQDAVGEMHIVCARPRPDLEATGWKMDDLATVIILLQLPEEQAEVTESERFFLNMGMAVPPKESLSLPGDVDLATFRSNFDTGTAVKVPCQTGIAQYILSTPSFVSGVVVEAFRKMFPNPFPNFTTTVSPFPILPGPIVLDNWKERLAYAQGEWAESPDGKKPNITGLTSDSQGLVDSGATAGAAARIASPSLAGRNSETGTASEPVPMSEPGFPVGTSIHDIGS
jgi:carbonic anhydrase